VFCPKDDPPRVELSHDLLELIYAADGDADYKRRTTNFFERNFALIALFFRNNAKVRRKGMCAGRKGASEKGNSYEIEFEVVEPNYYKVCFHTKEKAMPIGEMD
jgi:hypothetical protein